MLHDFEGVDFIVDLGVVSVVEWVLLVEGVLDRGEG